MLYTRRALGKLARAGLPAGLLWKAEPAIAAPASKPDSKWAGVQVGLNVPFDFGNNTMSGDETLERCLQLGISAVELRSQPVGLFLGTPAAAAMAAGAARGGGRRGGIPLTPEQEAARKAAAEELRKWRAAVPMNKVRQFRDNKWTMQATVEFEYPIPQGSDRMAETAKCLAYCKQCLLG